MTKKHKIAINVTISPENLEFLEKMTAENEFASISHGVDLAITRLKKAKETELGEGRAR